MKNTAYLLQGTFFSSAKRQQDIFEVNELFTAHDALTARQEAFDRFLSYLEVFLDSLSIKYRNFDQAVADLNGFIYSNDRQFFMKNPDLEIDIDFDKGLYLYFIPDVTDKSYTVEKRVIYNQKYLIHCFTNDMESIRAELIKNLKIEYNYYLNAGSKFNSLNETFRNGKILKTPAFT
jgi:hypothetical protein